MTAYDIRAIFEGSCEGKWESNKRTMERKETGVTIDNIFLLYTEKKKWELLQF